MILQTTTYKRDDETIEIAISFNRYQCRIQNGSDDSVVSFTISDTQNAQMVSDYLASIVRELDGYINAH